MSAANPTSRRVAPGSLVTLYGQSFSTETLAAEGFPLPTRLGTTEVIINGSKAPLLYVSPTQINALAPAETYAGRSGVIVRNSFGQNHGTAFDMTTAAPELFLLDARRAIALNQNGRLNGPNDPAAGGEVVTLYFTGQGATTPHVPSGHAAPSSCWPGGGAHRVLVAGREAKVHYLGLAPGFAGLAQANVEMPDGIFGELPVRIEIDGQLSEPGFVTVR